MKKKYIDSNNTRKINLIFLIKFIAICFLQSCGLVDQKNANSITVNNDTDIQPIAANISPNYKEEPDTVNENAEELFISDLKQNDKTISNADEKWELLKQHTSRSTAELYETQITTSDEKPLI